MSGDLARHVGLPAMTEEDAALIGEAWRARRAGGRSSDVARRAGLSTDALLARLARQGVTWGDLGDYPADEFAPTPPPKRRPCIVTGCGAVVMSTGPGHRMCHDCRRGRVPGGAAMRGRLG